MTDRHFDENNAGVVIAAGPGANPSSFPKYDTAVDPQAPLPAEERRGGDYIDLPDGGRLAPNGAVIHDPYSNIPEVLPDNEYTPEKEDLNLLIM